MKRIYKENIAKNGLLVVLLLVLFPVVANSLKSLSDVSRVGNLLVATSILAVTACFGNFAFTYERVKLENKFSRYWAHATTGLLMLLIGLSLEFSSVLCGKLVGKVVMLDIAWVLLYMASVMYDFWDLQRVEIN